MALNAKVNRNVQFSCTPTGKITVDSIDYRTDLTRFYGKVHGTPHTALRFDEVTGSTDIEGVDIERWFQFEDNGMINLEIDFMPFTTPSFDFEIITPRGNIQCKVIK